MKLLLGGGNIKKEGYTNLDILPLENVDIVADLNKGIPLEDNTVETILANNILEHLPDTMAIMKEMWRVCKPGATVVIKVPYFKSTAAFKDPTHIRFFTERTMEYFDRSYAEKGLLPEYQIGFDYKTKKITFNYYYRGIKYIPFIGFLRRHFWDVVKTIVYEIEVNKP